jgi:hypothetical protein
LVDSVGHIKACIGGLGRWGAVCGEGTSAAKAARRRKRDQTNRNRHCVARWKKDWLGRAIFLWILGICKVLFYRSASLWKGSILLMII